MGKVDRALVAQPAVWPQVIVAVPEVFNDDAGVGRCPELLAVEALVPESAVEAFHKAVLPGGCRSS